MGVGGGECGAHTSELSANAFYVETESIMNMVKKTRGITAFFHQIGGAMMELLHECQAEYGLPRSKPKVRYVVW